MLIYVLELVCMLPLELHAISKQEFLINFTKHVLRFHLVLKERLFEITKNAQDLIWETTV